MIPIKVMSDRAHEGIAMGTTQVQRLSAGALKPLSGLVDHLSLAAHFQGDAVLHGADPVIRSPHRLGEASGTAQLLIGIAGAAIWHARTGQPTDIAIDIIDALHYLHRRISSSSKADRSLSTRSMSKSTTCFSAAIIAT